LSPILYHLILSLFFIDIEILKTIAYNVKELCEGWELAFLQLHL